MSKKYTKTHEWLCIEGEEGTVGISCHAQSLLGDLVYVELPSVGATFKQGDTIAVVESVKAAADVYAPVSGAVTAINTVLVDNPGMVNESAEGNGWLFKLKIKDMTELSQLLDKDMADNECEKGCP